MKFSPIFCPKLGEKQKKQKRSSMKFSPIFCPKLGEKQKKGLHSNLVPWIRHWVRHQNLTRTTELFRDLLGPGTMYLLNPPLVGPDCRARFTSR